MNKQFDQLRQHPTQYKPLNLHSVPLIRYRAKVDAVFPIENRARLTQFNRCFLGVSMENENFSLGKLEGMVEWISRRYASCDVMVGDSLHRLTLQSRGIYTEDEALAAALGVGRKFIEESEHVFRMYSANTDFNILTCQAMQAWPDYEMYYAQLIRLFETDADFHVSIKNFGERYYTKNFGGASPEELRKRIEMSSTYFLEEFAIMACLQARGNSVMVYPGSLSSLAEMASGLHPAAPRELQSLTAVSLCFKKLEKLRY